MQGMLSTCHMCGLTLPLWAVLWPWSQGDTGWPKSCDTNVAAYCGLITNVMSLVLADMSSFHQPFEDFTKNKQKLVHFCSFQPFLDTPEPVLTLVHIASCLACRILVTLKKWDL